MSEQHPPPPEPEPNAPDTPSQSKSFPLAQVRSVQNIVARISGNRPSRMWLITGLCLIVALVLVISSRGSRGPLITVHFDEGHGLKAGDSLRYRGIEVGQVTAVELQEGLDQVRVRIRLDAASSELAREGSRFWIERPQFSLSRVRALDTIVGPKYVAVAPGPLDAPRVYEFQGDSLPLTIVGEHVEEITIRFENGFGLAVGDPLRHRGIDVGEVTAVDLREDMSGVAVRVRLADSARRMARAGSQFWIERPRVGFTGVRGLETIVGGRYVAVLPGPEDATAQAEFDGLEMPVVSLDRTRGGLEIVLESDHRLGVEAGAPVTHRGVQIGTILSIGLAGDAASVEAHAYIEPEFRELIRENTMFWSNSGIDVKFGLTGFDISVDSLATIAAGGVAVAVPENPGQVVATGRRFPLGSRPDDIVALLKAKPRLLVGAAQLPTGQALPEPQRGTLHWKEKTLVIRRGKEEHGWLLSLNNQRLLGLTALLLPPEDAVQDSAALEIAGKRLAIDRASVAVHGRLASFSAAIPELPETAVWPVSHLRHAAKPEDVVLVTGRRDRQTPVPAPRLSVDEDRWVIDPSLPIEEDARGAVAVALSDGAVIGLLSVDKKQRFIVPLSEEVVQALSQTSAQN